MSSALSSRKLLLIAYIGFVQIEGWIQKQHCVPYSKMLTHPIFPDPDRYLLRPTPASTSTRLRPGRLQVTVCDVSRLDLSLIQAQGLFCILALGNNLDGRKLYYSSLFGLICINVLRFDR